VPTLRLVHCSGGYWKSSELMINQTISHYHIIAKLGEGGIGEVYRAHDPRLRRDVAIKICAERFSEHFEREARAVASLNHPCICTLYDVGPNYLVMELVEGPTLAERIQHPGGRIAGHCPSNCRCTRSGT
jgi:eukaryotic-like serine/threonine-protein kinase